jgi:hypothetical protein
MSPPEIKGTGRDRKIEDLYPREVRRPWGIQIVLSKPPNVPTQNFVLRVNCSTHFPCEDGDKGDWVIKRGEPPLVAEGHGMYASGGRYRDDIIVMMVNDTIMINPIGMEPFLVSNRLGIPEFTTVEEYDRRPDPKAGLTPVAFSKPEAESVDESSKSERTFDEDLANHLPSQVVSEP